MKVNSSNRWTISDYIKIGLKVMPPRSLGGIDVTYRCNLSCKHCYFIKQGYISEWSTEQWEVRFEELKKDGFPFLICGWLGGEPLLRKDIIDKGRRYFKSNVVFEFYTPMKGEAADLWLDWSERDRIIDRIMTLRRRYGDFIQVRDSIYCLMRSDRAPQITGPCPFSKIGFSFDPKGNLKLPCQLGPKADCSRCGCILPFYSTILTQRGLLISEFAASAFNKCFALVPALGSLLKSRIS